MKFAVVALVPVLLPAAAAAERTTTVTLGVMVGGMEHTMPAATDLRGAGGPRLTLAWEEAPLPYLTRPGKVFEVRFVPEITAAALMDAELGEVMVGVGGRLELQFSQRARYRRGPVRNLRGAVYLLGRAFVIGEHQDGGGELGVGWYTYLGNRGTRITCETSVVGREQSRHLDRGERGLFLGFAVGWAL